VFRNVGNYKSDAGESPKRRHTKLCNSLPICVLSTQLDTVDYNVSGIVDHHLQGQGFSFSIRQLACLSSAVSQRHHMTKEIGAVCETCPVESTKQ
jgi:hypothetical protein